MRASHMELLSQWRDAVVRDDDTDYVAHKDGRHWRRSLSGTCMSCHTTEQQFCGACHDYLGVKPSCWDCHVAPERQNAEAGAAAEPAPRPGAPAPGRK